MDTISAVCTAIYSFLVPVWPQYCQPITEEHRVICFALIGPIDDWRWRRIPISWSCPLGNEGAVINIQCLHVFLLCRMWNGPRDFKKRGNKHFLFMSPPQFSTHQHLVWIFFNSHKISSAIQPHLTNKKYIFESELIPTVFKSGLFTCTWLQNYWSALV